MTGLKLGPLPDRVPSKLTITLTPGLKKALDDYATLYARSYGVAAVTGTCAGAPTAK